MRHRVSLILLAVLAGCQAAGPQGLVQLPVAGGGAAGFVSNNGATLIANNAGNLTGVVRGPSAGLIANNGASLIANNGAGLIANNGAGLIANNGGGYRLLLADAALSPIAHAAVTARDEFGEPLGPAVRADAQGRYTLSGLKPSGPVVFVTASYSAGGLEAVLNAAAAAPREGDTPAELDPATTLLGKKLAEAARAGAIGLTPVVPAMAASARQALTEAMSETAAVAAAVLDDNTVARVFDTMLEASPPLRRRVADSLAEADLAGVLVKTEPRAIPVPPSARPVAPPAPMAPPPALLLFDEAFAEGWGVAGTWNGEAELSSAVTPHSGASAIAWISGARGGLKVTGGAVDTTGYRALVFALRAGRSEPGLRVQALDGTVAIGRPLDLERYGTAEAGAWARFEVPLTDMAAGDRTITGFMLTEAADAPLPATYMDRIGLER